LPWRRLAVAIGLGGAAVRSPARLQFAPAARRGLRPPFPDAASKLSPTVSAGRVGFLGCPEGAAPSSTTETLVSSGSSRPTAGEATWLFADGRLIVSGRRTFRRVRTTTDRLPRRCRPPRGSSLRCRHRGGPGLTDNARPGCASGL
jgi:hypothetical protein